MLKKITLIELKEIVNNKKNIIGSSETCNDLEYFKENPNYMFLSDAKLHKDKEIYVFCLLTSLNGEHFIELTDEYTLADHRFPGVQTDRPCKTIFIHSNLHDVKDNTERLMKAIK